VTIRRSFLAASAVALLTSSSALAGWRDDIGVFRVGLVARPGAGSVIEGSDQITAAYSKALDMPVELYVARDYADLVDAQASGRIEYAVHTAMSYATVALQCACVTPLVAPVSEDGTAGIRSALIARADGPARASEISRYKVAFGPADSVSGALLPLAGFEIDDSRWQATSVSDTGHQRNASSAMLADGGADAMFGYLPSTKDQRPDTGGTLDGLAEKGVTGTNVLWTSDFLRYGPHAVRMSLPREARQALTNF
jgi:phosphonate transport system substrate-binding protein